MKSQARIEDIQIRAIAFHLPQFHPTAENDEWWGKGFTEWRNVTKARPLFPGHYQPHLPADLGFYDLRLPEIREAQADLARQHGIHGFCYYHYWFNSRRILERPFNEILENGSPDFPFCLCWANENWTRRWDGGDSHILLEQKYGLDDDIEHIRSLIPAFKDPRYILVNGKPLFLVYRTELMPDPAATAAAWQEEARKAGLSGLYLVRVENFVGGVDPASIGFDAAVEFAPGSERNARDYYRGPLFRLFTRMGCFPTVFQDGSVTSYVSVANRMGSLPDPNYKRFHCACPMWDNTARRNTKASIYLGSTPAIYEHWLLTILRRTLSRFQGDEKLVFINAWNEWAEGCHLEPDLKWGDAYLKATQRALQVFSIEKRAAGNSDTPAKQSEWLKRLFWRASDRISEVRQVLGIIIWNIRSGKH